MNTARSRRTLVAGVCCAALAALTLATAGVTSAKAGAMAPASGLGGNPVVTTSDGAVRGVAMPGGTVDAFLGLPYAAPPTGALRWHSPQPPAHWQGVRDATSFAPSCPQNPAGNPFLPPGPISEDCLYLNVYTPAPHGSGEDMNDLLVFLQTLASPARSSTPGNSGKPAGNRTRHSPGA